MPSLLAYLWSMSTVLLIPPILATLPPDFSTFLLLNKDLSSNQALSFNSNANPFTNGISIRNILPGLRDSDFWYLDQAYLGNWEYSTTTTTTTTVSNDNNGDKDVYYEEDGETPLVWTHNPTSRIVIGHMKDNSVNFTGRPATWLFLEQADGTFTINTYDSRFLGLDTGALSMPKLYPGPGGASESGFGGKGAFWEIVPVPTVEGDAVVSWVTSYLRADGVETRWLGAGGQVTNFVTITERVTKVSLPCHSLSLSLESSCLLISSRFGTEGRRKIRDLSRSIETTHNHRINNEHESMDKTLDPPNNNHPRINRRNNNINKNNRVKTIVHNHNLLHRLPSNYQQNNHPHRIRRSRCRRKCYNIILGAIGDGVFTGRDGADY